MAPVNTDSPIQIEEISFEDANQLFPELESTDAPRSCGQDPCIFSHLDEEN
jgi:hypothetical protein